MSLFKRVLNAGEGRKLKLLQSIVPEINALEPDMERLSDDELRAQTAEFRRRFERGEDLDEMLAEPFESFTFSPAGAAVYQLGQYGTAAKKLHQWATLH